MFTGLVEAVGTVSALRKHAGGARLVVETEMEGLERGESILVNGVCQTIATVEERGFACDVVPETLRVSNLGSLRRGSPVNLERALVASGRMGGHIVNGHVDGIGRVTRISARPRSVEVSLESRLLAYCVPKGSIAVNGVSLTIGPSVKGGRFTVFIIPETWERTNFKDLRIGSAVNVEVDIMAKYVEKLLSRTRGSEKA